MTAGLRIRHTRHVAFTDAEYLRLLAGWLPQQRWFAAKGQALTDLRVVSRRPLASVSGAEHVIVAAQIDAGRWQVYQVPVRYSATADGSAIGALAQGYLRDGLADAEVVRGLLTESPGPSGLDPEGWQLQCRWLDRRPLGALPGAISRAEQHFCRAGGQRDREVLPTTGSRHESRHRGAFPSGGGRLHRRGPIARVGQRWLARPRIGSSRLRSPRHDPGVPPRRSRRLGLGLRQRG